MSESDSESGSGTFTFPFSNGKFFLGVSAGQEKERKNDRSFEIVESFPEIISDAKLDHCEAGDPQWKYPITGSVGLDEVVKTYIELQGLGPAFARQVKKTKKDDGGQGKAGQDSASSNSANSDIAFTEELTFTTSYGASLQPSIELNPVVHDFRLTKASASLGGARKDIHKMTITIVKGFSDIPSDLLSVFEEIDGQVESAPGRGRYTGYAARDIVPPSDYVGLFEALSAQDNAKLLARRNLRLKRTEGLLEKVLEDVDR